MIVTIYLVDFLDRKLGNKNLQEMHTNTSTIFELKINNVTLHIGNIVYFFLISSTQNMKKT